MNENGSSNKLNGIRQIVKFKEILQKWQSVTLPSRANSPRGGSRAGSNPRSLPDRRVVAGSNPQLAPSDRRGVSASLRTHSDTRMLLVDNARSHSDRNVLVGESALSDSRASSPLSSRSGISPAISKRLTNVICDSDEDFCLSPEPPADVPEGYLAVYVGTELRRFIIPTSYLSHSLFKVLLEKAEEEFGFDHSGGLTIPCETETFKFLLQCMENHQKAHPDDTPAGAWKLEQ